tara:strand:- start:246 stop:485 length:240 start_codon:yes stop_codon:yes gene_type:complete
MGSGGKERVKRHRAGHHNKLPTTTQGGIMKIRPQVLAAILSIGTIAIVVVMFTPVHVETIAGGAVTAIGMLGMKLLEGE